MEQSSKGSNAKENVHPPKKHSEFKFDTKKINRRHTLQPLRSILKPTVDDYNTIAVIPGNKEKRRVSFAPEVTLHKITHYTRYPDKSLLRTNVERLLESQRRISLPPVTGTFFNKNRLDEFMKNLTAGRLSLGALTSDKQLDRVSELEITDGKINDGNSSDEIDEDNSTQTMDLSTEIVPAASNNQLVLQESQSQSEEPDANDMFQDAVQDLQEDNTTTTMNMTAIVPSHTNIPKIEEVSLSGDDTRTSRLSIVSDDNTKAMEIGSRRSTISQKSAIGVEEADETKTMELTGSVGSQMGAPKAVSPVEKPTNKRPLEITSAEYDQGHTTKRQRLSISSITRNTVKQKVEEESPVKKEIAKEVVVKSGVVESDISTNEEDQNIPNIDAANSSYSEQLTTELVPLAEVSNESIQMTMESNTESSFGQIESDHDTDDMSEADSEYNYQNVELSEFLDEVGVQFFDFIGPTERAQSVDFDTSHKASLIEYVKSANSIPEFRYFEHLITQYRSSIQNIRGIVSDFEKNVGENNPTSIREYYEQSDLLRQDLKLNYQALASFARQKAKKENLTYLMGLLKQLRKSYMDSDALLDVQLEKVLDIRKGILLSQQKLIERKAKLRGELAELVRKRKNINSDDLIQCRNLRATINETLSKQKEIETEIKSLHSKSSSEEQEVGIIESNIASLEGMVSNANDRLQSIKVPSNMEIADLRTRLSKLQKSSEVEILSIKTDYLKIRVQGLVSVDVSFSGEIKSLEVRSSGDKTNDILLLDFKEELLKQKPGPDFIEYIDKIKSLTSAFKSLIRDLTVIKLRYEPVSKAATPTGYEGIVLYQPGEYKLSMIYNPHDLIDFKSQVKVKATVLSFSSNNELSAATVLHKTIERSKLKIPTLKRFSI